MKLPLSWLKEYLPTTLSPEEIASALTSLGLEVDEIESDGDDSLFTISLTPNLVHCANVRGVARELAALTQEKIHQPKSTVIEKSDETIDARTSVSVENPQGCPRYACRLITGVKVSPSPEWLKKRLEQCGMRSVNNIVDITNLVMLELGHPLHAFDFNKLKENRIVVRNARQGEELSALDGKTYYPSDEMLLICDGKGPIAIAGVMGSAETEVCEKTVNVLLESAYFEPKVVRRTSKHLELHTEASYRFERGADPNGVLEALERATSWICELANGIALKGIIDRKERDFSQRKLSCRLSRANRILGIQISMSEIETVFKRLGFEISHISEDLIELLIPSYRHDIAEEIDLIEEIARLYGYDNIHKRERACYRNGSLPHSSTYLFEKRIRTLLLEEGLQELLTCDLISPESAEMIAPDSIPSRALVKLLNPRSIQQSILRPTLLPGLLQVVKHNHARGVQGIAGFEIGRLHFKSKENYLEPTVASIVLSGERAFPHWENKVNKVDFFDLKGIIENLLSNLKSEKARFKPSHLENFHPQRQAAIYVGEIEIGAMGEIHPETLKKIDLDQPVYFVELNLADLEAVNKTNIKMQPLPLYPASTRDWTLTLPEKVPIGALFEKIALIDSQLLESFLLLDVYRSDTLGSDKKNVTVRFVYRDRTQTLSVEDIEKEHKLITQKLIESEELR